MQDNKQGLQANPEYTIHYLSQEIYEVNTRKRDVKSVYTRK